MTISSTVIRPLLLGVVVLMTSSVTAQEPTDAWPRSLPAPATLTQLALMEIEAEEHHDKQADDWTRCLICRVWLYLDDEPQALKCAIDGSRFDKKTNLALFGLAQDQVRILGRVPAIPLSDVMKLTEEASWLWPLSIVRGDLDADRPELALRHLREVPVDKGTFGPVLVETLRLARQLNAKNHTGEVAKLAQQVLEHLKNYDPTPSDNPILAAFAKVCIEIKEPALADAFRHRAIALTEKYHNREPTTYSAFALMQTALANHATGNSDEAQRQLDQAIRIFDSIMSGDEVTDLDLSHRYEALLKMSERLHEFGLPQNSLHCLLSAADYGSLIGNELSRDGASLKLAEAARSLGHLKLAQQYSTRIQRPGFKLTDLRKQVERSRAGGRLDEARQLLESAEQLVVQHTDDDFHIGETAELGLSRALLGDVDRSREHFVRALKLSREHDQDFHQPIARLQVKAGQFEDAYQTLREMTERKYRVYALAELAQAVAKQDYEKRRK